MKAKRRLLWTHRTFLLYLPKSFSVLFFFVLFVSFCIRLDRFGVSSRPRFSLVCVKFSLLHVVPTDACRDGSRETRSQFYLLYGVHQSYNTNILTEFDIHKRTLYTCDVSDIKMIKIIIKKNPNNNQTKALVCVCWRTWIKLVLRSSGVSRFHASKLNYYYIQSFFFFSHNFTLS